MQKRFDSVLCSLIGENRGTVLLGVSGGVDSMCMAHLFLHSTTGISIVIAHANFGLRMGDCDEDERLVKNWATNNCVTFYSKKFDTQSYAERHHVSIEMAARELRYTWFEELRQQLGIAWTAVAHNLNDNAETLMLNLLRGSGTKGLQGMPRRNGAIIRPLMEFSREEIESFASANGIEFREDYTNKETNYARNKVRNLIFPVFSQINPSFINTLAEESRRFSQAHDVVSRWADGWRSRICRQTGDLFEVEIAPLLSEPNAELLLFNLLSPFGFSGSTVAQIAASLGAQSGKRFCSRTHFAIKDRSMLKIYPLSATNIEKQPQEQVEVCIFNRPAEFDPRKDSPMVLYADADAITFPLTFRHWQPSDRFKPLGMKGFRKLSDFFCDLKMDAVQKGEQVIITTTIEGEEQIVAIAGIRLDDRFKVVDSTSRVVSFRHKQA